MDLHTRDKLDGDLSFLVDRLAALMDDRFCHKEPRIYEALSHLAEACKIITLWNGFMPSPERAARLHLDEARRLIDEL